MNIFRVIIKGASERSIYIEQLVGLTGKRTLLLENIQVLLIKIGLVS